MKRMKHLIALGGLASALCLAGGNLMAQDGGGDPGAGGPPGGGGFGGGGGNFDPAQFQQMMMDNIRTQLEVKDDAEWNVLSAQVQKVMDARREANSGGGPGMGGMGRRGGMGGGPGGQGGGRRGQDNAGGGPGGGGRRGGQQSSPETEALRKAIDDNASAADLKAAVAKLVEARKQKQSALEKAQGDLRKLLSGRQEAIAYTIGVL